MRKAGFIAGALAAVLLAAGCEDEQTAETQPEEGTTTTSPAMEAPAEGAAGTEGAEGTEQQQ